MNLIVAVDKEWGIGNKGDLLARVRADLINFKHTTEGKTVIYGSNTLLTFPGGKVLPKRDNIILNPSPDFKVDGATVAHSLDELFEIIKPINSDDLFVIGGASMYRQLLPYCNKAYVTKFEKSFEKDVYIPDLDKDSKWKCTFTGKEQISDGEKDSEPGLVFRFTLYERVSDSSNK